MYSGRVSLLPMEIQLLVSVSSGFETFFHYYQIPNYNALNSNYNWYLISFHVTILSIVGSFIYQENRPSLSEIHLQVSNLSSVYNSWEVFLEYF